MSRRFLLAVAAAAAGVSTLAATIARPPVEDDPPPRAMVGPTAAGNGDEQVEGGTLSFVATRANGPGVLAPGPRLVAQLDAACEAGPGPAPSHVLRASSSRSAPGVCIIGCRKVPVLDRRSSSEKVPGLSLAGYVRWPDLAPAPRARVLIRRTRPLNGASTGSATPRQATCDAQGRFELTGLKCGTYALTAVSEQRVPWHGELRDVTPGLADVAIVLHPGASVAGRVVDDTGAPIDSFRMEADFLESPAGFLRLDVKAAFSDRNGLFLFEGLPEGRWRLRAAAPDHFDSSEVALAIPGATNAGTLVVERMATLSGTVVDSSGSQVARALVFARSTGNRGPRLATDRVDELGRFRLQAGGEVTLNVRARGFPEGRLQVGRVVPGAKVEGLRIVLQPRVPREADREGSPGCVVRRR